MALTDTPKHKINTKFVVILATTLALLVGGAAAFVLLKIRKSASELEAIGDRHIRLAQNADLDASAGDEAFDEAQKQLRTDYKLAAESYGKAWNRDKSNVDVLLKYIDAISNMPVKDQYEANNVLKNIMARKADATVLRDNDDELLEDFYRTMMDWAQKFNARVFYNEVYKRSATKLESAPDNVVALKYNAISRVVTQLSDEMERGEQLQVREDLEQVLIARPQDTDVLHYLAQWYVYDGLRVARVDPDDPAAHAARVKAIEYAGKALAANPTDREVQADYLDTLLDIAGGYSRSAAITNDDEVKEVNEKRSEDVINLARPVLDQLETALLKDPSPPIVVQRVAEIMPKVDREKVEAHRLANVTTGLQRTEKLLRRAVEVRPEILLYRLMLANVNKLMLNLDEAHAAYILTRDHKVRGNYENSIREESLRQTAVVEVANIELIRAEAAEDPAERARILEDADLAVDELEKVTDADARVLMLRGKIAMLRGQTDRAMQYIDQASARYSDRDVEALLLSARARQAQKQWGAAVERLEQVLAVVKDSPRQDIQDNIRLQLSEMLIRSRKFPEAREQLSYMLENDPESVVALRLMSQWHAAQEEYGDAIEVLEDSGLAETDPLVARELATLYSSNGQDAKARDILEAQLQENPGDLRLVQILLPILDDNQEKAAVIDRAAAAGAGEQAIKLMRLQLASSESGEQITLDQMVDQLTAGSGDDFDRALRRARIYFQYGQVDKSREYFEIARSLKPDNDTVVLLAMDLAIADQDFETARRLADDASKRNLDLAKGHFLKGKLAVAEGKLRQALVSYEQGLKLRPVFDDGWRQYGDILMREREFQEAESAYRKSLSQRPDNVMALKGLASAQDAMGRRLQALETLRTAVDLSAGNTQLMSQYLQYEDRYGDSGKVLAMRRELAETQPQNLQNRTALVMAVANDGDPQEALAMLEEIEQEFGVSSLTTGAKANVYRIAEEPEGGEKAIRDYIAGRGDKAVSADYLMLGRYLFGLRQVEESLAAYRKATELEDPQTRGASRELALILSNSNQTEQAATLFRDLYNSAEGQDRQRFGLSLTELLIQLKRTDEAESLLNKLDQDATADALRAMLAIANNDLDAAMNHINRSLQKNNQNAMTYFQRARLHAANPENLNRALEDTRQALTIRPDLVQAMSLQAQLALALGQNEEAARTLRDLLATAPTNNPARQQLAEIYVAVNDTEAAEDLVDEGLELEPENPAWLQISAGLSAAKGDTDDAIRKLEKLMRTAPNAQALGQLSLLYLGEGKPGAADTLLGENPEMLSASAGLQSVRGRALADLGKPDQAERVFTLALQRSQSPREVSDVLRQMVTALGQDRTTALADSVEGLPDPSWVGLTLAGLAIGERDFDGAIARLSTLRNTVPSSNTAAVVQIEKMQALCMLQTGDTRGARDAYRRLLDADPDNLEVLNNLAYLLANDLQEPQAALPLAQRARELAPNNAAVLDTVGLVYYLNNQMRDAQNTLEDSVRARPLPANTFHLGRLYFEQNDRARAKPLLEQSLELSERAQDEESAQKVRDLLRELR